jgi:shikimate kinase/3-dehydroquinate synthase
MATLEESPALVFCGFMGAGKSSAARGAAGRLGTDALDADELIESELGEPIASFFERHGETEFRRREEELVLRLLERGGVIALGGGAVESEAVRRALKGQVCVWCRVEEGLAWARTRGGAHRPLAVDHQGFRRRFERRLPLYESVARAILPEGGAEIGAAAAPWLTAMRTTPAVRMVWARSASGSYPAAVGRGALRLLEAVLAAAPGSVPERRFCVGDRMALFHHRPLLPACVRVIEVEGSEGSKTLTEAERVLRELVAGGARRDDAVLAFGGGVVGDLAGFCAAVYQRGVPVFQAPTTLVAQVDSAYGGKTGIDLPEAKNYVGAYHQPAAVLADPSTLATLPPEELGAGYVEMLKTGLIAGGDLWERIRDLRVRDIVEGDPAELAEIVLACARTKIDIVAEDERDGGRRAVLNLGHTVGHAIEAATGYGRYRHGEAVGLGLLAALRLSEADELREHVQESLAAHGLPTGLDGDVQVERVLLAMGRDKKRTGQGLGFVLLDQPGEPRWGQEVDADRVRAAVEELRSSNG